MENKRLLYAAIGAPVVIVKQARDRLDSLREQLGERTSKLTDEAKERIEAWAAEGEDVFGKLTESEAIDEITSRMDLDQVQEQVSKLREQLEDLLATWRANFRPETSGRPTEKAEPKPAKETPAGEPAAKKPAASAKKPAAKKPAASAKKPAAKKPTQKAGASKPSTTKAS